MTRGTESKQNKPIKVAKSMEEKQALLEKAAKETKDERIKRIEEDKKLATIMPRTKWQTILQRSWCKKDV
jgi:glutamate synthase domain-containing protein 3